MTQHCVTISKSKKNDKKKLPKKLTEIAFCSWFIFQFGHQMRSILHKGTLFKR